jgi:hypothetical protein
MIVSVSSIAVGKKKPEPSDNYDIYSGVDVQFGIIFIGPVKVASSPSGFPTFTADATVLATMADYLSLGCVGTNKMVDYTVTSGSKQFIAPIDDHFKCVSTLCHEYMFTFISPTNSKHDIIMRLFRDAFENDATINAITQKWGWPDTILQSISLFRKRMAICVDILVSPALAPVYLSNLEKDDLHEGRASSRPSSRASSRASKRRHSPPPPPHGGRKTVKNMKRYRYNNTSKSKYKSRHNKSKSKPITNSKLKCKRRMNMHTRRRCYT